MERFLSTSRQNTETAFTSFIVSINNTFDNWSFMSDTSTHFAGSKNK